jgi:hypothetical protein
MADDEFKPFDINALHRRAATQAGRSMAARSERVVPVMEQQKMRHERPSQVQAAPAALEVGEDGGRPCYTLFGQPIRAGQVVEVYTNRANGYMRGQIVCDAFPARPRLLVTLWNAWGTRDVDGLPPRVGTWELELLDGVMCRFTGALPQEID